MDWNVHEHGFALHEDVISPEECNRLISELGPVNGAGRRNLLQFRLVAALATSARVSDLVKPYVVGAPRPVRAIYFDKNRETNWSVTWHQDRQIAVREKIELPGFGPWCVKSGKIHVQPPVEILQEMLTIRLHLDMTNEQNGALTVVPGSHRLAFLEGEEIHDICKRSEAVSCNIKAGGAMLMRPLLLHSSGKATNQEHRRVLHIEYAGCDLPDGLAWAD